MAENLALVNVLTKGDTDGHIRSKLVDSAGANLLSIATDGSLKIQGTAADGAAASGNPLQMGGKDGAGNVQTLLTHTDGSVQVKAIADPLPTGDNNIGNVDVVTLPALPAGANTIGNVKVTDGTNFLPTMDAAARAGFQKITDGVNTMPTLDAAARAGFLKLTDGTNSTSVNAAFSATDPMTGPVVLPAAGSISLHDSAARTATGNGPDVTVYLPGAECILDITAASGTSPTLDIAVQLKDAVSGKYDTIYTFPQKTTTGTTRVFLPGPIGGDMRITYTIGGTSPSFTFSAALSGTSASQAPVAQHKSSAPVLTNQEAHPLLLDSSGNLLTSLQTALPAGTNNIGDVDIASLPAGNLGQRASAASLSTTPANDIADATYIGDIRFGEALPAGSADIGKVHITDGTNALPTMDVAARAGFVKVTDGTNTLPTMDAATRAGYVRITDGTNTIGTEANPVRVSQASVAYDKFFKATDTEIVGGGNAALVPSTQVTNGTTGTLQEVLISCSGTFKCEIQVTDGTTPVTKATVYLTSGHSVVAVNTEDWGVTQAGNAAVTAGFRVLFTNLDANNAGNVAAAFGWNEA